MVYADGNYQYGMEVIQASSLRELVEKVNDKGVMKEDIVDFVKDEENFFLLYYR